VTAVPARKQARAGSFPKLTTGLRRGMAERDGMEAN
jgi:hypothetical protein